MTIRGLERVDGPDPGRIVLLDPDPYLTFITEKEFADSEVVTADGESFDEDLRGADVVIAASDDERVGSIRRGKGGPSVVLLADGRTSHGPRTGDLPPSDGLLLRPFTPAELSRTVRAAIGRGAPRAQAKRPLVLRFRRWIGPLRVAAVAFAAVLELTQDPVPSGAVAILAAAFVYVLLRLIITTPAGRLTGADIAVAALLIGLTGGMISNYVLLGLVVAVQAGLFLDVSKAVFGGFVISAGTVPLVVESIRTMELLPASQVAAWMSIFPLLALAGSLGVGEWQRRDREGAHLLAEANRVLSHLYDIARAIPGGFESGSVADAVLKEAREAIGAPAGLLLVEEVGLLSVADAYGLEPPSLSVYDADIFGELIHGTVQTRPAEALPEPLRLDLRTFERWIVAPLRHGGAPLGLLLLASTQSDRHEVTTKEVVQRLADEAALALSNARLFTRVRELSVDEERRRLAAELHDGIAQVLAHVRLELDLLATREDVTGEVRDEASRLGRVVQHGMQDVRTTISGLRSSVSAEGLSAALRDYVRDLQGLGGASIRCRTWLSEGLDGDIESDIFRVAQEAISNALRHSGGTTVDVLLEGTDDAIRLVVEDNGSGLASVDAADGEGSGLGLRAMQDRAERIGASLTVEDRRGQGGTRVTLVCPRGSR